MGEIFKYQTQVKGSLVIVAFFIAGIIAGRCGISLPEGDSGQISTAVLCCLMLCVGISVGRDFETIRGVRGLDKKLLLLPFATIVGTLTGCVVLSVFFKHHSAREVLAVGSGFGYYSLSSIFITKFMGAEMGTIALLSNVEREIATLVFAPLLRKFAGPLAPISSGGATSMDTTLPSVLSSSGNSFLLLSVFHGFVVDFSVPFLVTLFCQL